MRSEAVRVITLRLVTTSFTISCSRPEYRSSVFSRKITMSITHILKTRFDARQRLDGPHIGKQVERFAQRHIHALKTAGHGRGDRTFQAHPRFVQRIEQILRQSFAGFENDGFVELGATPDNINAGGFNGADSGLRHFRTDAVAGNQTCSSGAQFDFKARHALQKWKFMARIERALLSVTDKTGMVDFAATLAGDGRGDYLDRRHREAAARDAAFPCGSVGSNGISGDAGWAREDDASAHRRRNIGGARECRAHAVVGGASRFRRFEMVVVNLYAFEKFANKPGVTREELIENIDIGGPTMIRAAAKNFQDVAVVVSPDQYDEILAETGRERRRTSAATHWALAQAGIPAYRGI